MRTNQTLILLILLTAMFVGCTQKQNAISDAEKSEGWSLLFDGKTMDGWRDFNGTQLTGPWTVENGTIRTEGEGSDSTGYIVTDKQYENFILSWDWKISKKGNSGLLYHVVEGPAFKVPYITGPEYQLIDNNNRDEPLLDWQRCGADYAMHLPDEDKMHINPPGEWNSSKLVFDNGHVEHWLNGEKILEFEAWSDDWFARKNAGKYGTAPEYGLAPKGVFSLQNHGYPAWFRNIKIKELPRKEKEAISLFNGVDLSNWIIYGNEKWYIQDSLLVCESGPEMKYGYLATREYYDDFDLSVDFKQIADGNSGVFFHYKRGDFISWQAEVAPKDEYTGGIYESNGRKWLAEIPPEVDPLIPGGWNTMRVKVVGPEVTTWLNGQEITHLSDELIAKTSGRIALQIHDMVYIKILWKNIVLKPL